MIKSYLRIIFREIAGNKLTSAIGIFGLSISVACCIAIYLFSQNILSANNFLKDRERIFLVVNETKSANGTAFKWGKTPRKLGPSLLLNNATRIDRITRFTSKGAVVKRENIAFDEEAFNETIQFVDNDFLNMFSFQVKSGDRNSLADASTIIISAETAKKYYGGEDPIGRSLLITIEDRTIAVEVGAVMEDFPNNSTFQFNILANFTLSPSKNVDWKEDVDATFLSVKGEFKKIWLKKQLDTYRELYNLSEPRFESSEFQLIPFNKVADYDIRSSVVGRENPSTLWAAIAFGLLLLLISCLNYINISLAGSSRRLKEIGLRKSFGASKGQIIFQFLGQNLVTCLFAVVLGLALAQLLFLPIFNSFFPFDFKIDYLDWMLWFFLLGTVLFTGFVSGFYPAFYIASFETNSIFRGSVKFGSQKNLLFRVFLGFQFGMAFIVVFFGVAFVLNGIFQRNLDWGYDEDDLITIQTYDDSQYEKLRDAAAQIPQIAMITGSKHHVGKTHSVIKYTQNAEIGSLILFEVGNSYLRTLNITILTGKHFDDYSTSEVSNEIIVNETFKDEFLGGNNNNTIEIKGKNYNIVGIAEDFHFKNFYSTIEPAAFILSEQSRNRYLTFKIDKNAEKAQVNSDLKAIWLSNFPNYPYNGYFQEDTFDVFFNQMSIPTRILTLFATISMTISALGLYGLVGFLLTKKKKEICIKKVLGASITRINLTINRPFLINLGITLLVATPISKWLVTSYLDQVNSYHIPINYKILIISVLVIGLTTILTIFLNLNKITNLDPATALREN